MASFIKKVYGLERDPFDTYVASPDQVQLYMAGRKVEKSKWTKVIQTKRGRGNSINFIIGDFGLGKTFSLYYILDQFKNEPGLLVRYLKFLPEDSIRRFGVDFVHRIFRAIGADYMREHLSLDPIQEFKKVLPEPANVLMRLLDGSPLAKTFLCGEAPLTKAELSKLGIVRKIDRTEVAKEYLIALLILLKQGGVNSLVLLIDEVEYIFSQMRGAQLGNVFNTLRDFYDLAQSPQVVQTGMPLSNMIWFFGISAGGWATLTQLGKREQVQGAPVQALLSRRDEVIDLTPLNPSESKKLIELRLKYNRTPKLTEKPKPLIPYTEEFVEYVAQLTLGNPRDIIKVCEYVLQDGLQKGVSLLTVDFAKGVLEDRGMRTEPA